MPLVRCGALCAALRAASEFKQVALYVFWKRTEGELFPASQLYLYTWIQFKKNALALHLISIHVSFRS